MTNADKYFRNATDEETAKFLAFVQAKVARDLGKALGMPIGYIDDEIEATKQEWIDWMQQEIPATPQKDPLCDTCKHAIDGVVDDFASVFCADRHGYFGQVTECKDYAPRAEADNDKR